MSDFLTGNSCSKNVSVYRKAFSCDVLLGEFNIDSSIGLLEIAPCVSLVDSDSFHAEGDINLDGAAELLDVERFETILIGNDLWCLSVCSHQAVLQNRQNGIGTTRNPNLIKYFRAYLDSPGFGWDRPRCARL